MVGHAGPRRALPESVRHERVDDEWSFVETLRHLVFAVDVWMGRMVRGEEMPFHRVGLPPTDYPDEGAPELGIDLDARPSYDEVVPLFADRTAQVRRVVDRRDRRRAGRDPYRCAGARVGGGVALGQSVPDVIMDEYCEHRRYAVRDLAVLEGQERR